VAEDYQSNDGMMMMVKRVESSMPTQYGVHSVDCQVPAKLDSAADDDG